MKKVVLAYSGGLDTTFCALHLSQDLGYEVHAVLINTGGFSSLELEEIENRQIPWVSPLSPYLMLPKLIIRRLLNI